MFQQYCLAQVTEIVDRDVCVNNSVFNHESGYAF